MKDTEQLCHYSKHNDDDKLMKCRPVGLYDIMCGVTACKVNT